MKHETIKSNVGVETCASCGAVIPEGRQVCPTCETRNFSKELRSICNYYEYDCGECSARSMCRIDKKEENKHHD